MIAKPIDYATPEDDPILLALDAYLTALHAGRPPDSSSLASQHPELAPALACLEELHGLIAAAGPADGKLAGQANSAETAAFPPFHPELLPSATVGLLDSRSPFGKYELLEVLGRGGMGVVYKARQTDVDRFVALKLILGSDFVSGEQLQRFHAEAHAAAVMRHPHILQVYEAGQALGQHYIAMPYIEGTTLAGRLREGLMPFDDTARCMASVARAVAYLHDRGLVHRDLKPSNILLDGNGWPYVTDFGLVKMLESASTLTSTGAIVGTPSYMAPEQASGRNQEVGPLSDVYSLGAILYEMLTGRPPFRESTPLETLVQVMEGEPASPRQLNPGAPCELEWICLKAMAKAPEQRYASADALADDLERHLRCELVQARPDNFRQRLVRWARLEPGLAARLSVLVVCSLIVQINYSLTHPVSLMVHLLVMAILALWALISLGCQALLRRGRWPSAVRMAWLAADALLLTAALLLAEGYNSPLAITYGAFIVASGLWFRVDLVWFTTLVAILGYAILVVFGMAHGALGPSPHYHLMALVCLAVVGSMVSAQVRRVRVLSSYYENRPRV